MRNGYVNIRLTPAVRFFWRCLAVFLVFAQVASAAGLCLGPTPGTSSALQASSVDCDPHDGNSGMVCASDLVPADQVTASEHRVDFPALPDLAPGFALVLVQAPITLPWGRLTWSESPPPPLPHFLQFERLLL
jgi:hypothetical protein